MDPFSIFLQALSIASIIQKASRFLSDLSAAPRELRGVGVTVQQIQKALRFIRNTVENPESIIHRPGAEAEQRRARLKLAVSKCEGLLDDARGLFALYRKGLLGGIEWARGGKAKIQGVNGKLTMWLTVSYEPILEAIVEDQQELRNEVRNIRSTVTQLAAAQNGRITKLVAPNDVKRKPAVGFDKLVLTAVAGRRWAKIAALRRKVQQRTSSAGPCGKPLRRTNSTAKRGVVLIGSKDGKRTVRQLSKAEARWAWFI